MEKDKTTKDLKASDLLNRIKKNIPGANDPAAPDQNIEQDVESIKETLARQSEQEQNTISLEDFYGYEPVVKGNRSTAEHRLHPPKPEKKERPVKSVPQEMPVSNIPESEYNLMSIFGMEEKNAHTEKREEYHAPAKQEAYENDDPYDEESLFRQNKRVGEYEDRSQIPDFLKHYKRAHVFALLRLFACLILVGFTAYLEFGMNWKLPMPSFFNKEAYPVVSLYLELQVLVLEIALLFPGFCDGFKALITGRADNHSAFFLEAMLTLVYYFRLMMITATKINCFGLPMALSAFFVALADFLDTKGEIYSFRILASGKKKRALYHMPKAQARQEMREIVRYLPDDNKFLAVANTDKIDHFKQHISRSGKTDKNFKFLILAALCASFAFGLVHCIKGGSVGEGFDLFYADLLFLLPLSVYLLSSYPMYRLSVSAFDEDSAVIGTDALNDMTEPATISLSDEDLFGKGSVRLIGVRTYGQIGMDKVLRYAAAVFGPAGGSLGKVLDDITESFESTDDMEYLSTSDDGIEAAVLGQHVHIGTYHYMMRSGLSIPYDTEADADEDVFMYLAVDGDVCAKLRLRYIPGKYFGQALKSLFDSGTTAVLRTFDPCIDLPLICRLLDISERSPLKIIHVKDPARLRQDKESADSTVFSVGSISNLMETLLRCSKTRQTIRTATILSALSLTFSVIVLAVVLFLSGEAVIPVGYLVLYQLFWILPPMIVARFFS